MPLISRSFASAPLEWKIVDGKICVTVRLGEDESLDLTFNLHDAYHFRKRLDDAISEAEAQTAKARDES